MQKQRIATLRLGAMALDALVLIALWFALLHARVWLGDVWSLNLFPMKDNVLGNVEASRHQSLVWLIVPVWLFALHLHGAYHRLRRIQTDALLLRTLRSVGTAVLVLLAVLFLLQMSGRASRTLLFAFSFLSVGALFASHAAIVWAAHRFWFRHATQSVLVVGCADAAVPLVRSLQSHPEWGLSVTGFVCDGGNAAVPGVPTLGGLADLHGLLESRAIDHVFLTPKSWSQDQLAAIATSCEEVGVPFSMEANFLGLSTSTTELTEFDGWNAITFSSTPTHTHALLMKRAMDLVASAIGLVLLAPLLGLVALLVKLEDGGPVLFVQERSGLYGRTFPMLKFRSMVVDAEARRAALEAENEMDGPVFKIQRDPRITRIGAFLRKTSIDELPQLWNVLRGEMSLVGPRPPLPSEVAQYERWQMRRLSMKPGITCIWQVSGRNEIDFETWMKLDLQYIDNWTLLLDVKLLLKTIPVVLFGVGAR